MDSIMSVDGSILRMEEELRGRKGLRTEIMMMKEGCDDGESFFFGAAFLAGAFFDGEDIVVGCR